MRTLLQTSIAPTVLPGTLKCHCIRYTDVGTHSRTILVDCLNFLYLRWRLAPTKLMPLSENTARAASRQLRNHLNAITQDRVDRLRVSYRWSARTVRLGNKHIWICTGCAVLTTNINSPYCSLHPRNVEPSQLIAYCSTIGVKEPLVIALQNCSILPPTRRTPFSFWISFLETLVLELPAETFPLISQIHSGWVFWVTTTR